MAEFPAAPVAVTEISILTCSMARDIELFSLLARSIDDCVDARISHNVIVPRRDVPKFRRFANHRREILAQEDVLPRRFLKLPAAPAVLSRFVPALCRPIYLDARLRMVRGWILQQVLKIEMTRRARGMLFLHVDSDVFFFRDLVPSRMLKEGKVPFFRAETATRNPLHATWGQTAGQVLGLNLPASHASHYVENCVPWLSDAVQAMTDRMERVGGRAWHETLTSLPTFSEYYLYGIFLDEIHGRQPFYSEAAAFCRSWWPNPGEGVDTEKLLAGIAPHQSALAVQSTEQFSHADRGHLYMTAKAGFPNGGVQAL